ncbi:MAG: PA2169 family four-helix-bundle protein [Chloroflexi bacterium]|nr:PA2169 family four-helix-bundle protein [Chloroflexota bacterium]
MSSLKVVKTLNYLYRIVDAGEKGYAVSASNVSNQGLKLLLKSHAQQRSRFKAEILAEIQRLGGDDLKFRNSFRGVLHRGRINIFSALAAGNEEREKIILNEIMVGERAAVKTYEAVLKKELPLKTWELVSRQFAEVKRVVEQMQQLRGKDGMLLIVQLFNSEKNANTALQELGNAGFQLESVQKMSIQDAIEFYTARGATVFESSLSGSVGGALWGGLIGAVAGISAQEISAIPSPVVSIGILIALAGILAGSLIGAGLGFAIGTGISGEDAYAYDKSSRQGRILLLMQVKVLRTSDIGQIMENVKIKARAEELIA